MTRTSTRLTRARDGRAAARRRRHARELTEAHLDAAEAGNHALNAWLTIDRDGALARPTPPTRGLRGAGETRDAHPLLGIPVALKDLISVEGGQCTAGSRILEGYIAPYDAHITERLRAVGAVILGKTNMDEFAMGSSNEHSAYGPVPIRGTSRRVPGGSSGGSAVAVAAYHAPLSLGTDTGGSIRQPAALTGIVGLKPTYGRVSRYGIVAFASSLDQIGPFARDVRDAAALLHAVAGRDERDSTSAPVPVPDELLHLPDGDDEAAAGLRGQAPRPAEGVLRRRAWSRTSRRRIEEAVAALEGAGATVEEVSLPHTDYGLATYYIVAPAEASANLARYDGDPVRAAARRRRRPRQLPRDARPRLRAGGQAPDHARHVRPVGRLLRRVLREGAEGPDADQARLRHAVRAGLRRPRRADLAIGRLPLRRQDGRPGRDVPVGRLHAAR